MNINMFSKIDLESYKVSDPQFLSYQTVPKTTPAEPGANVLEVPHLTDNINSPQICEVSSIE